MLFRKSLLFLFASLVTLTAGCTTRYQDMLLEKDARIRELSGDVARLRNENDEVQRRGASQPAPVTPVNASTRPDAPSGEIEGLQKEIGDGATVSYRHGRISIGVEDSVTFDSGSTALKDSSHRTLKNVASVLKGQYAGRRFYVEGHTDSDPIVKSKWTSNRHLSVMRADSVARYLIDQGVPERNIAVVGYGQYDPKDPKSKARNRRVEIVVGDQM